MNTARFLKYVGPFYNIMHERFKVLKRITEKVGSSKARLATRDQGMALWVSILTEFPIVRSSNICCLGFFDLGNFVVFCNFSKQYFDL